MLLFATAATSYLYTTSYTYEEVPEILPSAQITPQPSKDSAKIEKNEEESIDKFIQNGDPTSQEEKVVSDNPDANTTQEEKVVEQNEEATEPLEETPQLVNVSFEVPHIGYDGGSFGMKPGSTVHDVMQFLAAMQGLEFVGSEYGDLGFFVESIGGIKNDKLKGKYWIYYINGEKAKIGISNYIIQPNDIIFWKYETSDV